MYEWGIMAFMCPLYEINKMNMCDEAKSTPCFISEAV